MLSVGALRDLAPYQDLPAATQEHCGKLLRQQYEAGASITGLAADTAWSRRQIRKALDAAGTTLRQRPTHNQLVATLAARYPTELVTVDQTVAALCAAHGGCSRRVAARVRRQHNADFVLRKRPADPHT